MNNRQSPMSVAEIEQFAGQIMATLNSVNIKNFATKSALSLLLGTAAKESSFKYVYQLGSGPARSYFQIEPATAIDVVNNHIVYNKTLMAKFNELTGNKFKGVADTPWWREKVGQELVDNLEFAIFMCRCCYYRQPFSLAVIETPEQLAKYWKKYFNTIKGKGHEYEFVDTFSAFGLTKYLK